MILSDMLVQGQQLLLQKMPPQLFSNNPGNPSVELQQRLVWGIPAYIRYYKVAYTCSSTIFRVTRPFLHQLCDNSLTLQTGCSIWLIMMTLMLTAFCSPIKHISTLMDSSINETGYFGVPKILIWVRQNPFIIPKLLFEQQYAAEILSAFFSFAKQ